MGFFVLGIQHQNCPVEIREMLHFASEDLPAGLLKAKESSEISEFLILSTCNRVEFYGFSDLPGIPEDAVLDWVERFRGVKRESILPYLKKSEGEEAVHHLFRVAAGLDSLVVGENEILGQLRESFRAANSSGSVSSLLYRLIEKALKVGKEVRTQTKINEGAVSIPSVAVELAEKIFGRLAGEKVMILGTGEMATLALKNLKNAGAEACYVVSRNQVTGQDVAQNFDSEWLPLESWQKGLSEADILITSTSSLYPVVRYEDVKSVMPQRKHRPLFVIDIAVPRDVESRIHSIDDVYLYNIDDLKGVAASNLRLRRREIREAEVKIEHAVTQFQSWLERLEARPTIESFEAFLDEVLEKELSRHEGSVMTEEKKNEIRSRIRAKLMHPPMDKIKQASHNGGVKRYLEALHSLFGLERKTSEKHRKQPQ